MVVLQRDYWPVHDSGDFRRNNLHPHLDQRQFLHPSINVGLFGVMEAKVRLMEHVWIYVDQLPTSINCTHALP